MDDFIFAFNLHNGKVFVKVSEDLCIDESFSRWYGLGGCWIQVGLPHYVAIDRKPENGCELWTLCDGRTGIMLSIEIVKGAHGLKFEGKYQHNTAVVLRLVEPFNKSKQRMAVYGDSYFASVGTAEALWTEFGAYFTGVIKGSTARFPKALLSKTPTNGQGNFACMTRETPDAPDAVKLSATVWRDRTRRYLISSQSTSKVVDRSTRYRYRNCDDISEVDLYKIEVDQPEICSKYYEFAGLVDLHNYRRQHVLNLEKKFQVKDWVMRIITSVIGIIAVNAYLLYVATRIVDDDATLVQKDFMRYLAKELCENTLDKGVQTRSNSTGAKTTDSKRDDDAVRIPDCVDVRKQSNFNSSTQIRGRCYVCRKLKTNFVCSECPLTFVCRETVSNACMRKHRTDTHE